MPPTLSSQQIRDEILQCGKDPNYFIANYVRIYDEKKGLVPFNTFQYQKDLIKDLMDYRFTAVLKARQLGISTITQAYVLWLVLFHKGKNVLIIATKYNVASAFVRKTKDMYTKLPYWLKQIAKIADVNNRSAFNLTNDSMVKASTTSPDAGRSEALSLLVIDEAAHIERMEELWAALYPTLSSTKGKCVVISTPCGAGNFFHKVCTEAKSGENDFHLVELPWDSRPDRDQAWYEKETKNMTSRDIGQELLCVLGGTKIITDDGFKYIEDIKVGDLVLTHTGKFQRVTKTMNRLENSKKVKKVSVPMCRKSDISITTNHPILTLEKIKKVDGSLTVTSVFSKLLETKNIKTSWNSLDDLEQKYGQYVINQYINGLFPKLNSSVFKNNIKEIDISEFDICVDKTEIKARYFRQKGDTKRFISVDYDLGKFLGLYIAEGNILNPPNSIQLAFHSNEHELKNFVKSFCNKYEIRCVFYERETSNCTVIHISNKFLIEIIKLFTSGRYSYNKLIKNNIFETNIEFIRGMIDGVWLGDGYHNPKTKNVLRLVNEKLIYQIRTLMTLFDLYTRVSFDLKKNPKHLTNWILELNSVDGKKIDECTKSGVKSKKGCRTKFYDDKWWGLISNISDIESESPEECVRVYNIEVEKDNSYICENLIVHNCNFNMSGNTVISPEDMKKVFEHIQDPLYTAGIDRNLWVWEDYQPGLTYFISADVARGDGEDFSAFHVFKVETMEIVAEYKGKITPDLFSEQLNMTGREYGECMIAVEINSNGYFVTQRLIEDLEYPNMYYSTKGSNEFIEQYAAESMSNTVPGFSTTTKTRPLIIAKFEEMIRMRSLHLYSKRMYEELKTFIWNNAKPSAARHSHDDLIMACAIGCYIKDQVFATSLKDVEYKKAFMNAIHVSTSTLDTRIPGQQGYKPTKQDIMIQQGYYMGIYKG